MSESGASAALPAWIEFMRAAQGSRPIIDFPQPGDVEVQKIDPASGLLAAIDQTDAIDEVFLAGTAPSERAVLAPDAGVLSAEAAGPTAANRGKTDTAADETPAEQAPGN